MTISQQAQARQDPRPDTPVHAKPDYRQLCVAMIIISIVVHAAFQRLPELAKPATVWLTQALIAWCDTHGVASTLWVAIKIRPLTKTYAGATQLAISMA